ncbi:saccharopine dehydrogenase family protein [Gracilibacillus alcaliphilus]|uniref:saccharopine dehydrogenase family protein n=1 Tax=Gracilibacillus alcaliphilus TaxID=1401441 RepID=UPI00195E43BE|nr:saccharopine dehydrogenase NADP-binding domain-containing protein [Gracilibacillus alcaliphilus]MBM7678833.1 saccharopine dehydrogenase-like NADP-dependent oxidoreductase [Gracilibacillus alcaliphilus]
MVNSVMIIGGYGEVGGNIAKQLIQSTDLRILIAGRRLEKAVCYCQQLGASAHPVEIDIRKPKSYAAILQTDVVIMCMDQQNTALVQYCLEHHIHYIDITANFAFHKQIEQLKPLIQQSTVIMSVGFAPGLSNLLANHLIDRMEFIEELHITILLGLGEKHGVGAMQWLLEQMNQTYHIKMNGATQSVRNFSEKKITYFKRLGKRSSYLFNFSDQHVLQRNLPQSEVQTYLTFDVEWINRLLAIFHRLKITRLLKYSWVKRGLIKMIQGFRYVSSSSDICAIKVEAVNRKNKQINEMHQIWYANNEAMTTAYITALVVKQMIHTSLPYGTYHIDDLFCLGESDINLIKNKLSK